MCKYPTPTGFYPDVFLHLVVLVRVYLMEYSVQSCSIPPKLFNCFSYFPFLPPALPLQPQNSQSTAKHLSNRIIKRFPEVPLENVVSSSFQPILLTDHKLSVFLLPSWVLLGKVQGIFPKLIPIFGTGPCAPTA